MIFGLAGRKSTAMGRQKKKFQDLGYFNVSRNYWPMARIIDVNSNKKRLARSLLLCMGEQSGNENSKRELVRPIDKIVLIMRSDEARIPTKKAKC